MNKSLFGFSLGLLVTSAVQAQYSPYLPNSRELLTSTVYVYQTFDSFWAGDVKFGLSDSIVQQTAGLTLEYGINERFALDLYLGYVHTAYDPSPSLDGLDDTRLGLRWLIAPETSTALWSWPALAVRVGATIEGTYEVPSTGVINAPGAGASGYEVSVLVAKALGETGLVASADFGYRDRAEGVPSEFFGSATLGYFSPYKWSLGVTYKFNYARSGLDIGGPGFDAGRFPEIKERQQYIQVAVGYELTERQQITIFGARTLEAQNAGDKSILGVSFNWAF